MLRWVGHVKRRDHESTTMSEETFFKKDSGDGTTREIKARKTEAEMDGMCQPRYESHRNDERWSHDITGWRRIVSAAATPQPSESG